MVFFGSAEASGLTDVPAAVFSRASPLPFTVEMSGLFSVAEAVALAAAFLASRVEAGVCGAGAACEAGAACGAGAGAADFATLAPPDFLAVISAIAASIGARRLRSSSSRTARSASSAARSASFLARSSELRSSSGSNSTSPWRMLSSVGSCGGSGAGAGVGSGSGSAEADLAIGSATGVAGRSWAGFSMSILASSGATATATGAGAGSGSAKSALASTTSSVRISTGMLEEINC